MKKIYLSDVGILPGTDITLALYKLFKENPYDTEFVFENAKYFSKWLHALFTSDKWNI